MCGAIEELLRQAREQTTLDCIRALKNSMGVDYGKAMDLLQLDEEQKARYRKLLDGQAKS